MEVLSSRVLVRPVEFQRSFHFYATILSLAIYREYGAGASRGVVFFLGGGFLELSGRASSTASDNVALWLQVRDVDAVHQRLREQGVEILKVPTDEPWGLREMWVADPDGIRIAVIQVPEHHPLRRA